MSVATVNNEMNVTAQVGNPLLGQIRDFIDSDEPTPIDPMRIVARTFRGRIMRIGWMTFLAALVLAVLAWISISPAYQSTGVVRILPREAKLLYTDADDSRLRLYDAFTNAEVHLMQSRPILERAWHTLHDQHHASDMPAFPVPRDAGDLGQIISIKNRKGLVTVATKTSDRNLSAAAVNAVLDAYESHKDEARDRVNELRRSELEGREQQLASTLASLDAGYLEVGGEHDVTSLSKAHIAKTAQLEVLEERIGELDNTIAQFQRTGAVGADDIRNAEIQRALLLDQAMAEMTYDRANRLAELSTLRSRYRPMHSRIVSAELELKTLEAAIAERRDQITTLGNVGALTGGTSQSAEQSLDELESVRQKLLDRRVVLRTEAGELIGKLVKIRRIVAEQKRVGELLDETKLALDEVIVETQAGLSRAIDVIARGKVPQRPIEDKRKPVAFGAAFFGMLLTLFGYVMTSIFDPRVLYSDDLKPDLAQKISAAVTKSKRGDPDLSKVGVELRNEIDIKRPGASAPIVLAVAGTAASAGTSRLAIALGCSFSASQRSVLLVDVNGAGRVSERFDLAGQAGLSNVAAGESSLANAVACRSVGAVDFDVLGAGIVDDESPRGGFTACTLKDFRGLTDNARAAYDVVVLDLGELAAGRHSALAASVSDELILVARAGDRKSVVSDAATLLDRLVPGRYSLVLDEASSLDPMLAEKPAGPPIFNAPENMFGQLKRHLEKL